MVITRGKKEPELTILICFALSQKSSLFQYMVPMRSNCCLDLLSNL